MWYFEMHHVKTWYFEMHHVKTFFVPHHDFFVLWDVHSLYVYLQEESLRGVLGLKKLQICLDRILFSAGKQQPCG